MIRHQAKGVKPRFETKSRKLRTTISAEMKAATKPMPISATSFVVSSL